jgi:transcriptional regulator with GAF, ATPase, and Fis domain
LSEIGQRITSTLDLNMVLEVVYVNINDLMAAEVFGIGLYHADKQEIEYRLAIEKGQRYKPYTRTMENKNQFPIWCIENKHVVFINAVFEEYNRYLTSYQDESSELEDGTMSEVVQSLMYLPLMIADKVIGILTVQSFKKNAYSEKHLMMLKTLASYISIAIENSKTYLLISDKNDQIVVQNEELYQQHEEIVTQSEHLKNVTTEIQTAYKDIQTLSEIGQRITSTLDLNVVLEMVYANVNELMTAEVFGIGLYHADKQEIEYRLAIEKGQRYKPYTRTMENKNQFPIWCIENKKEVFINAVFEEYNRYLTSYKEESSELEDGTMSELVQSLIYLPLKIADKVIGILTVQSFKKNAYSEKHLMMLQTLASYISIAIENSKTYLLISEKNDQIVVQNEELYQQHEEIVTQSEHLRNITAEIQAAYKDIQTLSEIGQRITSTLDLNMVLEVVYDNVNELMAAEVFGIGLYQADKQEIEYRLAIEKGQRYKPYTRTMEDKNQFPIWCIDNKKEIFINAVFEEYNQYLTSYKNESSELEDGTMSEVVQSLIYLPLMIAEKVTGIITVQSFKKGAYSEKHLMMLKTLASYISIAIENSKTYLLISEKNDQIVVQNEELYQQHEEIITQRDFIAETNRELASQYTQIRQSVEAAKLIQEAILPQKNKVNKFLTDYFVIYRPKDVVSGDFYWIEEIDNKIFVAVVDCTGHGVPGAFMSMIANTLLDKIVKVQKITTPNEILQALNEEIHSALKQKDADNNHGMDAGLVRIDKNIDNFVLSFAGAKRPLYYISAQSKEVETAKGNKFSIGGRHSFDKIFTEQIITLPYHSTFYLLTDGYTDQCNKERIALGSAKLLSLIAEASVLPLCEQKTVLENELDKFKKGADQRDDILFVGVKVTR